MDALNKLSQDFQTQHQETMAKIESGLSILNAIDTEASDSSSNIEVAEQEQIEKCRRGLKRKQGELEAQLLKLSSDKSGMSKYQSLFNNLALL